MGELAKIAMAKNDAQAQIIQSIAQGQKPSAALVSKANAQQLESINLSTDTATGRLAEEKTLMQNNPAKQNNTVNSSATTTSNPTTSVPYQLSAANKVFINNALRNSSPAKLQAMKTILDTQLKN